MASRGASPKENTDRRSGLCVKFKQRGQAQLGGRCRMRSLLESVAVQSPPIIQITEPTSPAQHAAAKASTPINRRAYFLSTSRIIDRSGIIDDARTYVVPALIAAAWRARLAPLPGIPRGEYPQSAHPPRLQPRRFGISGPVRGQRDDIDHGRAAASRLGLDRATDAQAGSCSVIGATSKTLRRRPGGRGTNRRHVASMLGLSYVDRGAETAPRGRNPDQARPQDAGWHPDLEHHRSQ
jgi:hypothetical protein